MFYLSYRQNKGLENGPFSLDFFRIYI